MGRSDLLAAYAAGGNPSDEPPLSVEMDVVWVDRWWPASLRLGPRVFMVRRDPDSPDPSLPDELAAVLASAGLRPLEGDRPLIEAITLQRLGVLSAEWQLWAADEAEADVLIDHHATGGEVTRPPGPSGL